MQKYNRQPSPLRNVIKTNTMSSPDSAIGSSPSPGFEYTDYNSSDRPTRMQEHIDRELQIKNNMKDTLTQRYSEYVDKLFELENDAKIILARHNNKDLLGDSLDPKYKLSDREKNILLDHYQDLKKEINKYRNLLYPNKQLDDIYEKNKIYKGAYRLASLFKPQGYVLSPSELVKATNFLLSPDLSETELSLKNQILRGSGKYKKSAKRSYRKKSAKRSTKSKRATKKSVKRSYRKKSTKRSTKGKRATKKSVKRSYRKKSTKRSRKH